MLEKYKDGQDDVKETALLPVSGQLMDIAFEYKRMMFFYEAGIEQLTAKLQILNGQFRLSNDRNPIEDIQHRVKSIESIQKKMERLKAPMTPASIMKNLNDIAGVRVICPFKKDVYRIADFLLMQDDITLVRCKDYIKNPKPNGYRSLHLILMVEVSFSERKAKVPVEVQLRTIAMNFWASLEHQIRYKKSFLYTEDTHRELKACAEMMADADERMQRLADKLPEV